MNPTLIPLQRTVRFIRYVTILAYVFTVVVAVTQWSAMRADESRLAYSIDFLPINTFYAIYWLWALGFTVTNRRSASAAGNVALAKYHSSNLGLLAGIAVLFGVLTYLICSA